MNPPKPDSKLTTREEILARIESIQAQRAKLCCKTPSRYPDVNERTDAAIIHLGEREEKLRKRL